MNLDKVRGRQATPQENELRALRLAPPVLADGRYQALNSGVYLDGRLVCKVFGDGTKLGNAEGARRLAKRFNELEYASRKGVNLPIIR